MDLRRLQNMCRRIGLSVCGELESVFRARIRDPVDGPTPAGGGGLLLHIQGSRAIPADQEGLSSSGSRVHGWVRMPLADPGCGGNSGGSRVQGPFQ